MRVSRLESWLDLGLEACPSFLPAEECEQTCSVHRARRNTVTRGRQIRRRKRLTPNRNYETGQRLHTKPTLKAWTSSSLNTPNTSGGRQRHIPGAIAQPHEHSMCNRWRPLDKAALLGKHHPPPLGRYGSREYNPPTTRVWYTMRKSPEAAKDTRFYQRAKKGTLCVRMHKGIMSCQLCNTRYLEPPEFLLI